MDDGAFAGCLERTLTAVWSRLFAATGRHYDPPTLLAPDTGKQPGEVAHRAYYAPHQGIHVPAGYLADLRTAFGLDAHRALAFALAHETGHHVQFLLHPRSDQARPDQARPDQAPSQAVEMQADCYAGVWAHAEAAAGMLTAPAFLAAASGELRRLSATPSEVSTHGSAAARIDALTAGMTSGDPAACDAPGLTWAPG